MIKSGCLCTSCGRVFTKTVYFAKNETVGVALKKNALAYYLEPFSTVEGVSLEDYTFKISGKRQFRKDVEKLTVPDNIKVKVRQKGEDEKELDFRRACPHCGTPLESGRFNHAGRIPLFVIALVGKSSSGKSAFVNALSHALSTLNNYNRDLHPRMDPNLLERIIEEKHSTSTSRTRILCLYEDDDTADKLPACGVIILDVKGELYRPEHANDEEYKKIDRLLFGDSDDNVESTGFDGAIFIDPLEQDGDADYKFDSVDIVGASPDLFKKLCCVPVAYVRTFADRLVGDLIPAGLFSGPENDAPYIDLRPDNLASRIQMQSEIHRIIENERGALPVFAALQHHAKVFLVQNCGNQKDDKGRETNDYSQQFNVLDPLLYILNKLFTKYNQGGSK